MFFGPYTGLSCLPAKDGSISDSSGCVLLVSVLVVCSFEDGSVWVRKAVSATGSVSMATVGTVTGVGVAGFAEVFVGFLLVLVGFDVVFCASGK